MFYGREAAKEMREGVTDTASARDTQGPPAAPMEGSVDSRQMNNSEIKEIAAVWIARRDRPEWVAGAVAIANVGLIRRPACIGQVRGVLVLTGRDA